MQVHAKPRCRGVNRCRSHRSHHEHAPSTRVKKCTKMRPVYRTKPILDLEKKNHVISNRVVLLQTNTVQAHGVGQTQNSNVTPSESVSLYQPAPTWHRRVCACHIQELPTSRHSVCARCIHEDSPLSATIKSVHMIVGVRTAQTPAKTKLAHTYVPACEHGRTRAPPQVPHKVTSYARAPLTALKNSSVSEEYDGAQSSAHETICDLKNCNTTVCLCLRQTNLHMSGNSTSR